MKKIVYKNDGEIPVEDILCTTYQMRNFYTQFRDAYASNLDVMNYIQHLSCAQMCKEGWTVLDVCCGRGMMLPFLRYYAKGISKYIGVDIEPKNMVWKNKNICNGKDIDPLTHYPFEVEAVVGNVAQMSELVKQEVDFIIYTSSIEHMHKEHGRQSLVECGKILKKGSKMFLSCPNTPEDQDGFDTQYKAHVYEWKISELRKELADAGFVVEKEIGLYGHLNDLKKILKNLPKLIADHFTDAIEYLPREFTTAVLFTCLPKISKEVGLICRKL